MILTPITLWKDFETDGELMPVVLKSYEEDGVKYEHINFFGRYVGGERVLIYGVLAMSAKSAAKECILLLPDSEKVPDKKLLSYFVGKGYTVFFVDYSGSGKGADMHTVYPECVAYANIGVCRDSINTVEDSVKNTCWFEWVAVGAYARRYLAERFSSDRIGLVGVKDGGELAWKLAYVAEFSCAVAVNACGWRIYRGMEKFTAEENNFNENNYKFLAGLDSQAYAQFVKCPILALCSTGDRDFNYDRAYDTFARINPKYLNNSSISYSLNCGDVVDQRSNVDMFMFLDSNVKKRYVFMPKPVDVKITVDADDNLIAVVSCDKLGIVESCGVLAAEDDFDFSTRNWSAAKLKERKSAYECEYYLNVYEKSRSVFVLAYAVYSNGFTVWSKLAAKKISGRFRNSGAKSKIMYSSEFGPECFTSADISAHALGGVLLVDEEVKPRVVTMCGLSGVSSGSGLKTSRVMVPQFAPDEDSVFKMDVAAEEDTSVSVIFTIKGGKDEYALSLDVMGEVWQSKLIEAKWLKNKLGRSLKSFTECETVTFTADKKFAVNNLMWL